MKRKVVDRTMDISMSHIICFESLMCYSIKISLDMVNCGL
jgi:hypothetical protein